MFHAEELKEQQRLLEAQQQPQQQQQQQQPPPSQSHSILYQQQQSQSGAQLRNQSHQLLTQLLIQQLQQEPRILDYEKPKSKDSETPKSEKDYITHTSICPSTVLSDSDVINGISVENSVHNMLKVIEVSALLNLVTSVKLMVVVGGGIFVQ